MTFYQAMLLMESDNPEVTKLKYYYEKISDMVDKMPKWVYLEVHIALATIADFVYLGGDVTNKEIKDLINHLDKFLADYLQKNKRFIIDYPDKDHLIEYERVKSIVMSIEHILLFIKDALSGKLDYDHLLGLLAKLLDKNV